MENLWKAFVRVMGDIFGNLSSGWFALLIIEPQTYLDMGFERLIIRVISGTISLVAALIFRFIER